MPANNPRIINRLVIDTNVIVRGAMQPKGPSARLFRDVMANKIMLVCAQSLSELRRVFVYDRVMRCAPADRLDAILRLIEDAGEPVVITGQRQVVMDDPDDDKFIEMAEIGRADCLVSTDGDLLRLRPVREGMGQTWDDVVFHCATGPLPIMRPTELMKALETGEAL